MNTVNTKTIFKRSLALLLVIISALTLAACGSKELKTPYGSLTDTTYMSGDGYKITEKELYEEMRLSGTSILNRMFYEILFKDELAKIDGDKAAYKQELIDYANNAIFGSKELEVLEELTDDIKVKNINSYVDSMLLIGITITEADIDNIDFENHADIILDYYKLDVARKIYAKEKLDADVLDEENTNYISIEKDIQTYFASNVEKQYPLSFISIRFSNKYESDTALRNHALKAYRSQWYVIPDPRVNEVSGYALEKLTELGFEEKNGTGTLTEDEFQKYYDSYSINTERPTTEGPDIALTTDATLQKVLEIYNEIYPYRDQIDTDAYPTLDSVLEDESLVGLGDEKGLFTKEYDDFLVNSANSLGSVRTYLYSTLSTEEGSIRFTAQPRQWGNFYYILFKLVDHDEEVEEQLNDDETLIIFEEDGTTLTSWAQEYYDKIKEAKLTNSYITTKAADRLADAKIVINDFDLYYILNNTNFTLAKKSSKDVVATINGIEITVDDFYAKLESQMGVSVSLDMTIKKVLLASDYVDQITAKEREEYKENVENMIRQFSQDYFASSGFPKEIGRKNFLRIAFRANSIDEAVTNIYITSKAEELYLTDYEGHYGLDVYEKFTEYAHRLSNQYFSLSSSHLLIYIDMDEDETPDVPSEFFETLTEEKQLEYRNLITELMQVVHTKASQYTNIATGLSTIVTEFGNSAKMRPDSCDTLDGANAPECTWAKYKRAGLVLKYESLGSTTNQTNWPTQSSSLDDRFYERIIDIYDFVKTEYYDVDQKFPSYHLDTRPSSYEYVLETNFGWHLILATGGAIANTAKFTYEDDTKLKDSDEYKIYEHISIKDRDDNEVFLNAYSDEITLSVNQTRIYVVQSASEEGVQSIPTKVRSAITSYLDPVLTQYTSSYNQLHLLHKLIASSNYAFANADNGKRLDAIMEVNQRQFNLYAFDNELYMDIYEDWFTTFN